MASSLAAKSTRATQPSGVPRALSQQSAVKLQRWHVETNFRLKIVGRAISDVVLKLRRGSGGEGRREMMIWGVVQGTTWEEPLGATGGSASSEAVLRMKVHCPSSAGGGCQATSCGVAYGTVPIFW